MRPLTHFEGPLDYLLFSEDQELYEALSERAEKLIEEEKNRFLGEFSNPPMSTFKELTSSIEERKKRRDGLIKLGAPAIIVENEIRIIDELKDKLKNKEFISFSDKAALEYKRAHDALTAAFWQSKEYKTLLKEIHKYNEQEVSKILDISSFTKSQDTLSWLDS